MNQFTDKLAELHPHALVAWDRAGVEIPTDAGYSIVIWTDGSGWRESPTAPDHRYDGIGCVRIDTPDWWIRCVLFSDQSDDLGVRWFVDRQPQKAHNVPPKAIVCPHCERTYRVNESGLVRKHQSRASRGTCPASGRPATQFTRAPNG